MTKRARTKASAPARSKAQTAAPPQPSPNRSLDKSRSSPRPTKVSETRIATPHHIGPEANKRPTRSQFVGRHLETDFLKRCIEDALLGEPQVALVGGEAGIGKSRLLRETRDSARRSHFLVGSGRSRTDTAIPYLPYIEALEPLIETVRLDESRDNRADLALVDQILRPGRADHLATDDTVESPVDGHDQLRVFQSVTRVVIRAAELRPTLITIDDLHWADPSSSRLLSHIIFAIADYAENAPLPLLLVCGHRPFDDYPELNQALASVRRERVASEIDLGGLAESDLVDLLESLGVSRPSATLVRTIEDLTLGNPLFVEEVVFHLRRRGALTSHGRRTSLSRSPDIELPQTVLSALEARTESVSGKCQELLVTASCLGDLFSAARLADVSDRPEEEVSALLDEAIDVGLIDGESASLHFAHPLMRHAFYSRLKPHERHQTHLQIAEWLQTAQNPQTHERTLELAHHLIEAGTFAAPDQVVRFGREAGDQAYAVCVWSQATRYYDAALAQADRCDSLADSELASLHLSAGRARYRTLEADRALEHYKSAIALFRRCKDMRGVLSAEVERARVHVTLSAVAYGTMPQIDGLLEAMEVVGSTDELRHGFALALLSQVYWSARKPDNAIEAGRKALAIGTKLDDHRLASDAAAGLALCYSQVLEVEDSVRFHELSEHHGRLAGDPCREAAGAHRLPIAQMWLGHLEEAEGRVRASEHLTRETQEWSGASVAMAARVAVAVLRGDFETAEQLTARIVLLADRSQYPWGGYNALPALATAYFFRGEIPRAEETLEKVIEPGFLFADPGPAIRLAVWTYQQLLRIRLGVTDSLRNELMDALRGLEPPATVEIGAVPAFCSIAEMADRLDEPSLGDAAYQVVRFAWSKKVVFTSAWVFMVPRVLAVLEAQRGNSDAARAMFAEATEIATRSGASIELGRTHLDHARVLIRTGNTGDREVARDLLTQSLRLFGQMGMPDFEDDVRAAAREADLRIHQANGDGPAPGSSLINHIVHAADVHNGDSSVAEPQGPAYAKSGHISHNTRPRKTNGKPLAMDLVVMVTDMVDSTATIATLGEQQARKIIDLHNEIITMSLRRFGAELVRSTGDGFVATHTSVRRAVLCALNIQSRFAAINEGSMAEAPILTRIGMAYGPVTPHGEDLFGITVNLAARLCDEGAPGDVLVSESLIQATTAAEYQYGPPQTGVFKGFKEAQRYASVRMGQ